MASSRSAARSNASTHLTDGQIAAEAIRRLAWDAALPPNVLHVKVLHGRISLLGELHREQQRTAALEDVSRLFGVTGISDHTTIKPSVLI
ncbi:BON domain-containing protein [Paraburkholderia phytofirmans]|jgi:osmotically-inducible protein OsmY|uniref:Transporter n=1 Tax=Paraburkholderia phytofirmans OLGA172 TaxID=1417228 RepID=A0A160FSR5_9BURK|nr:BON domain-containing protein [Paraburkholderia phytofirmans]ANB75942.1 transporter [Paraburkholderia phytofirmans OLGA172]